MRYHLTDPRGGSMQGKLVLALTLWSAAVFAADTPPPARPAPATLIAAQREAMKPFARLDGVWRGTAWTIRPDGTKHEITQTERIGSFLDGSVKVIEGRGYDPDGTVTFNAFGIISYNVAKKSYSFHSYAMGQEGDFAFELTADGYIWSIPAGPMTIRYTAVVKDGKFREIGERIMPGKDPVQIFEMNLKRVSDTDWPAAGAVPQK
jgi:hypothetical protein